MPFRKLLPKPLRYPLYAYDLYKQEQSLNQAKNMQHEEKSAKAREIVHNSVGFAMGAALVPFPGADLLAVTAVQVNMLRQLAKLYNLNFIDSLGKNVISAIVGSSMARLGASLVKAIPGVGTVIGELSMPALAGASTYALGHVVSRHFHKGGTLENIDLRRAREGYEKEMEQGKEVATEISQKGKTPIGKSDEAIDKIKKLAELRDEGILTEEEFQQMKGRLLAEI